MKHTFMHMNIKINRDMNGKEILQQMSFLKTLFYLQGFLGIVFSKSGLKVLPLT